MSFVNVDDGDLRIQYSSGWKTMADDNAYNGTLHYATEQGDTATLVFTGPLFLSPRLRDPLLNVPVYRNPGGAYRLWRGYG